MKPARHGTTLIELLVALTISAIVLVAGYGLVAQMNRISVEQETWRSTVHAANLRSDIIRWFAQSRTDFAGDVFPFVGSAGATPEIHGLLTAAEPYVGRPVLARLFVDDDPKTARSGLLAAFSDPIYGNTRVVELDESVTSMTVRYLSIIEDQRVWSSTYSSSIELPRGIEITLHAAPGQGLPKLLELPILIAVGPE